ncbi:MAG: GNAT family N-acetyltransferase [Clostridia bacterium]|nr:GNAT family N-acetyltransferase [Clostridia bacterium]
MVALTLVPLEAKDTLRRMMEIYLSEFAQWDLRDMDENGLYGYEYLDCYWEEENRFPYFIRVDGRLAGFILVNDYPEVPGLQTDFCLSEFFVLPKYRRCGTGSAAARMVFDLHRGQWQLKYHPGNAASLRFWRRIVEDYTSGDFRLIEAYPDETVNYDDSTPADVILFAN